ncbi:NAD(P)-dependent oxidoreductase [Streptacidiphilus sp. PB12-B1b]|uniref:NAD-dependent epimerase/dehydratase family protein n=1 Tax=Streptacidiphilus sp. PB12-B1b TaxID=2705012 RepID=UPI0015FE04D4|nr:NAD(P)-dependent oxidoreductase [Streptacidiphilus sp. PB12-B1b]QMU78575.1 NAD(P)-dependent oxidoreductase [Streptacidiphilus sp. PB12-B1b]
MTAPDPAPHATAEPRSAHPAPRTVLLTGAAGGVGTFLRASLPGYGYRLRCTDLVPVPDDPEALTVDLRDPEAVREAVRGTDAVVHLGGLSVEDTFDRILDANIRGAYHLYEAVRLEGVRRVVFASSSHTIGFVPRPAQQPEQPLPVETPHRPDTYYGLSKCFGESLASLYADKYGVETVSIRLGSCYARPRDTRMLATWLSPADAARLVHAALTAPDVHHSVVYGISANTRGWWDLAPARALGYRPQDDAEVHAAEVLAEHGELAPDSPEFRYLGGAFTRAEPQRR